MKTPQLVMGFLMATLNVWTTQAQTWESLFVFQDSVNIVIEDFDLLPDGDIVFCAMVRGDSFTYQDSVYRPETDSSVYRCAVFGQLDATTGDLTWVRMFGNQYFSSTHSTIAASAEGQIFAALGSHDPFNLPGGQLNGEGFTLFQFSQSGEILRSYTPVVTNKRGYSDTVTTDLIITPENHLAFGINSDNDFTTGTKNWTSQSPFYYEGYFLEFDTTFQYIRGTKINDTPSSVAVSATGEVIVGGYPEIQLFDSQLNLTQTIPITNGVVEGLKINAEGDVLFILRGWNSFGPVAIGTDTIPLQATGGYQILVKTSATFTRKWSLPIQLASPNFSERYWELYLSPEIAFDRNGDIIFSNYSTGDLVAGNRIFQPVANDGQHYTAKVSGQTGALQWLTFGGGYKVQIDTATNKIVVMGAWSETMRFPDAVITTPFTVAASFFRTIVDDNLPRTPNTISGTVFRDGAKDCSLDPGDTTVGRQSIVVNDQFYFLTKEDGTFVIEVDTGSFSLSLAEPFSGAYFQEVCPVFGYQLTFDTLDVFVGGNDFALGEIQPFCPPAIVSISTPLRRPCVQGITSISVENNAGIDLPAEILTVTLPDSVWIISANLPYTQAGQILSFTLPIINAGETLIVELIDSVSCSPVELLGQSACITAEIDNLAPCLVIDPTWNESNLILQGECLKGKAHMYIVANNGTGDMTDSVGYEIYADTSLIESGNIWLASGDSLIFQIPSGNYQTYMQVLQVAGNPFSNSVSFAIEACPGVQSFLPPISTMLPPSEQKTYTISDVVCDEYRAAYDPNDKTVWPSGIPPLGITKPGTPLTFRIRFQNTGNDTAFKVVLVDTLSEQLDVRSFLPRSASHPYKLKLSATTPQILTVTFDNILLPDSTTDEPGSHGAFFYQIYPVEGLPEGTRVENFADIYFDFNPPIRTDTTLTTYQTIPKTDIGIMVSSCHPGSMNVFTADAGSDKTYRLSTPISLQAEAVDVPGFWGSNSSEVTITDSSSPTTDISIAQPGDVTMIWSIIECGRITSDSILITVLELPAQPEVVLSAENQLSTTEQYESYEWFLDGITFSQDSVLSPEIEGEYSVVGIRNGCASVESVPFDFVKEVREGIQARFWKDASGMLMVEVTGIEGESVNGYLADMRGKSVARFEFILASGGTQTESLGEIDLPNGIYFFRVVSDSYRTSGTVGLYQD